MIHLTQVTPVSLAYLTLGGFAVAFSLVSLLIKERLYIGEVVLGTGFGIIIGPQCANIFDPRSWGANSNRITLEVMRIVLATGLFAVGVELPKAYLAEHARSLLIMVIPTMAFGWVLSAGIIHALVPGLNFVSCLAISACLTPTDPILAAAIVGGKFAIKNVPTHIRRLLSAESATNDGLAYPFLSLAIYLTLETSKGEAVKKWFLVGWLYQVILGTILGAIIGLLFSYLLKISHRKGLIDRESIVAQYLALAIFTTGVASSLGVDDLLAAFAAGSAVSWDGDFNEHTENELFSSVIDLLLNCASFVYIGAWLPFDKFNSPELGVTPWRLVVFFIALLIFRRIPFLMLLYKWVPDIKTWREALVCGHFGPMGVSAVFVSTLAISELPTPSSPPANQKELLAATLQPIVAFVVLCSVLVHGLSIPAFWFGRKFSERTLSISTTWTRTLTVRGRDIPDWVLWTRRGGNEVTRDLERAVASQVANAVDVKSDNIEIVNEHKIRGSDPNIATVVNTVDFAVGPRVGDDFAGGIRSAPSSSSSSSGHVNGTPSSSVLRVGAVRNSGPVSRAKTVQAKSPASASASDEDEDVSMNKQVQFAATAQ